MWQVEVNLQLDDSKHISFQQSRYSDQGLIGNATHVIEDIAVSKDQGRYILKDKDFALLNYGTFST